MNARSQVASTIKQFFSAMDTQDLELMKDLLPKESEMIRIGTDKDEIWKGWDILMKATHEQFENLDYYRANIHDLTINISETGETAWYFHLLDAKIKSHGTTPDSPECLKNRMAVGSSCRHTSPFPNRQHPENIIIQFIYTIYL